MSEAPSNELTHLVKLRPLPGDTIVIDADEGERSALAARFGLAAVKSLRAEVALSHDGKSVRADGTLNAQIMQYCAISAEAFAVTIAEPLALRFVEEADTAPQSEEDGEIEVELSGDDLDEIEFTGDAFDLGEAVAQSLGLAIDPYAEGPQADAARAAAGIVAEGEQNGPLAEMLKGLKTD